MAIPANIYAGDFGNFDIGISFSYSYSHKPLNIFTASIHIYSRIDVDGLMRVLFRTLTLKFRR